MIDAVRERVLEALGLHRALGAHAPGLIHADAVGREELSRRGFAASCPQHPRWSPVVGGEREGVVHKDVRSFNVGHGDRVPGTTPERETLEG